MSPVTVHEVPVAGEGVQVAPPGLAVTAYDVIALVPVDSGADQVTRTDESSAVPETLRGGPGLGPFVIPLPL